EVVALLLERAHQVAVLLQAAAALQGLLRFGLVFPEIGRGGARLEAIQFVVWAGGLKDSSVVRRRASWGRRSGASDRRRWACAHCTRRRRISSPRVAATETYAARSPRRA